MSREDYVRGHRFALQQLTAQHERGYHVWAIGVVRRMRGSRRWTRVWRYLAQARANQIAYLAGVRCNPDYVGWLLRATVEPLCWLIGAFVAEQEWRSLYDEA